MFNGGVLNMVADAGVQVGRSEFRRTIYTIPGFQPILMAYAAHVNLGECVKPVRGGIGWIVSGL